MTRRIEPSCANCKHLKYAYKQWNCETCHTCDKHDCFIPIREIYLDHCGSWEVKQ